MSVGAQNGFGTALAFPLRQPVPFPCTRYGKLASMQTREIFDLAITLADRLEVISQANVRVSESHLHEYWATSRSLLNLWGSDLRRCTVQLEEVDYAAEQLWLGWLPLLEEILVTEMLTRVWTAVLECCDEQRGVREWGPIGHGIFRGQLDARRRVLNLLLRGRQQRVLVAWGLNRLRQQLERWTDLLLSLAQHHTISPDLFHDGQRLRHVPAESPPGVSHPAALIRAAANGTLADTAELPPDRAAYHQRIASAILGCWSSQVFRDQGSMLSPWQIRILTLTDDTQGLVADWLRRDSDNGPPPESDTENPGTIGRFSW